MVGLNQTFRLMNSSHISNIPADLSTVVSVAYSSHYGALGSEDGTVLSDLDALVDAAFPCIVELLETSPEEAAQLIHVIVGQEYFAYALSSSRYIPRQYRPRLYL